MEQEQGDNGVIIILKYGCYTLSIILICLLSAICYALLFPSIADMPQAHATEVSSNSKEDSKFSTTWESTKEIKSEDSGEINIADTCTISFNSLSLTSKVHYPLQNSLPQVVLLDYTYKNTGVNDLIVDSSDFIVTDKAGALLETYPVEIDLQQPLSIKSGEDCHAVFAFGVKHASADLSIQIRQSTKLNSSKLLKLHIQ